MKTLLSLLALLASITLSHAQSYIALMDGAQDGGGLRQGSGTVDLTLTGNSLSLSGSFSGITTPVTVAHIHGPAGPLPGAAGVLYNLHGTVIPTGVTSGSINGLVTLVENPIPNYSLAQQLSDLNAGLWYINIHNSTFPGGEIRGQILVPEPSILTLIGLGTVGMLCWRRRS
ncbi:MAG TPA: CHRD domain-containing protein [Verrucomicrobiota bacterium]|mgnify:CR=1 FL=1|nr:CHRD domain-containing protein [Verrucomicrobiota bacterium]